MATAIRLSALPDVLIQDVADAPDIHPFMLSRWRKLARGGLIVTKGVKLGLETDSELKRLRDLEKKYRLLQEAHELPDVAIRFASDQERKSSSSSKQTGKPIKSQRCGACMA